MMLLMEILPVKGMQVSRVQAFPSSQSNRIFTQPVSSLQVSSVHGLSSVQLIKVLMHPTLGSHVSV